MKCPICGIEVKNKIELILHLESTIESLEIDIFEVNQELDELKGINEKHT